MSDSDTSPLAHAGNALEAIRTHAKDVVRRARAGDPAVLTKLRELLPRLSSLGDTEASASIKLADVHHALARQYGLPSWAALKAQLQETDPLHVQAKRFLSLVRDGKVAQARRSSDANPALRRYSIHTAAALYDADALSTFLEQDPALARSLAQQDQWEPIVYVAASREFERGAEHVARGEEAATLLLDAGASPNTTVRIQGDGEGRIPVLYFACVANNAGLVRLLLARGANPNDGESVYHAAERDHRECLELLLAAGANLSAAHASYGNTPLYFLANYRDANPLCASSESGMAWLLDHGADPRVPSYPTGAAHEAGATPLHRVAAYKASTTVAAKLVASGADVNARRDDGRTPYQLATRNGNAAVADWLAAHGADTTITPADTLLGACARGDAETARRVVRESPGVMQTLTREDLRALPLAAEQDRDDSVRLMAELGWDLSAEGEWGGSALHHAAWRGRPAMVRQLLALGAPVNYRESMYGSSPVAWAAHGSSNAAQGRDDDYVAVVNLLLDAGAERAPSLNKWNEPPEALASSKVARLLADRGFAPP